MALADKVSDAWITFARRGDPNTPKLPHWQAFNGKERPTKGLINNVSHTAGWSRSIYFLTVGERRRLLPTCPKFDDLVFATNSNTRTFMPRLVPLVA